MNRLTASLQRFAATTRARTLEFLRDRSALSWNLLFPIVLVGGFAMIFSGEPEPLFRVAVMGAPTSATAAFLETPGVATEPVQAQDTAIQRVARQRIDMLLNVETQPVRYWINPNAQSGALLEHLLRATLTAEPPQRVAVAGDPIRYVDWVLPGILAMNVMFSSLWGVGYGIVRYRKNGYLKRLNATPLTALEFICAQLASRLGLVVLMTSIMFAGCQWLIGFRMAGSALDLLVVAVLGSVAMIALGLIIAARVTSEELASGMLNIFSWPMLVLSGVFYSIDEAPQWLQGLAQWLPLTHILDAARAIMLDGAGLWEVRGALLALAAMSIALLVLGASLFKWTPQG